MSGRQHVGMQSIKRQTLRAVTAAVLVSSLAVGGQVGASPNTGSVTITPQETVKHCSYFIEYITIHGVRFPVLKKVCSTVSF